MTRRERLLATLRGEAVDRPPVSFYEIGGWQLNPDNPDPYNVHNAPDWRPLVELAERDTELMRFAHPRAVPTDQNRRSEFFSSRTWEEDGSRFTRTTLRVANRTMTSLTRRDRDVNTVWTLEHLLKDAGDAKAYLQLPDEVFACNYDLTPLRQTEDALGDAGVLLIDTGDPLCAVASLFAMADYTVLALLEPQLFHSLLEQQARRLQPMCEFVAREFPGRLWRIYGPEYATPPYLPPRLFREYVLTYTGPMVRAIQTHGGWARIHCHGRLRDVLPMIAEMGAAGLDPIEPPPQGDVELADVRRQYGRDMVLFGNIEASELENLPPAAFEKRVQQALRDGTFGTGHGFVLMPSACPYGRRISSDTLRNYETMVRLSRQFGG